MDRQDPVGAKGNKTSRGKLIWAKLIWPKLIWPKLIWAQS